MDDLVDYDRKYFTPICHEHELKCWPKYFEESWNLQKTFEIRKDDRGFKEGDSVLLREWNPDTEEYSGRFITGRIRYLIRGPGYGLAEGYVVFQLGRIGMYNGDPMYWDSCFDCKMRNHCGSCECCGTTP